MKHIIIPILQAFRVLYRTIILLFILILQTLGNILAIIWTFKLEIQWKYDGNVDDSDRIDLTYRRKYYTSYKDYILSENIVKEKYYKH